MGNKNYGKQIIFIAIATLVAFFLFGSISKIVEKTSQENVLKSFPPPIPVDKIEEMLKRNGAGSFSEIRVPAVDSEGNGVTVLLKVDALPGDGKVLTDINQLLFWVDTQFSMQTAQKVAKNITGVNISNVDIIYSIETDASLIEGESAGAALAVVTIAALSNKKINESVMITGTIESDGTVGPVGSILEKAKAAKESGATLFLVPKGQSEEVNYVPKTQCEQIDSVKFCRTDYERKVSKVTSLAGIQIEEISEITDALKYFMD